MVMAGNSIISLLTTSVVVVTGYWRNSSVRTYRFLAVNPSPTMKTMLQ